MHQHSVGGLQESWWRLPRNVPSQASTKPSKFCGYNLWLPARMPITASNPLPSRLPPAYTSPLKNHNLV